MGVFRWLSDGAIPPSLDLRLAGWALAGDHDISERVGIAPVAELGRDADLLPVRAGARRLTVVSGVDDPDERARLLAQGFGDAVGQDVTLAELSIRARRLPVSRNWLPRRRTIARLELDLLTRDGLVEGQPIGLKPREFELLWRLADTPDQAVSRQALVHDVLRLSFEPASNSINVHMSRLRGKLLAAGLHGVVETTTGGYRLCLPEVSLAASWANGLAAPSSAEPRFS
jgi:two-component system OmpR family response regulator